MFLTAEEATAIDADVSRVESRTGVQVVPAIIGKADSYIELPWKAFALGASLAAFGVVLADAWRPEWATSATPLLHVVTILGAAAACSLLAVFMPPFARIFLRATHSETEVRLYAQSLFLTRELFKTRQRLSVLVLVSLFERRIEILPDVGLHGRVGEPEWRAVVVRMAPHLRESRPFHALQEGLAALEALLVAKGFQAAGVLAPDDGLSDRPIEERGA